MLVEVIWQDAGAVMLVNLNGMLSHVNGVVGLERKHVHGGFGYLIGGIFGDILYEIIRNIGRHYARS